MSRIAIVTDSTASLPQALLDQYQIQVIPLYVLFGQASYRDGVDITVEEFYRRLSQAPSNGLPTTSQPSAGDFRDLYRRLQEQGAEAVISVHISGAISGTVTSALQAKEMVTDLPVQVVDSRSTSFGLGFAALAAARAAEAGATLQAAAAAAEHVCAGMHVCFLVDTLRYLHMGGRIGGASALLGTALDIKPLLELREGRVEALGKARSRKRGMARVLDHLISKLGEGTRVRAAVLGAEDPQGISELQGMVRQHFDCVELFASDISPVLGTHTGPGALGVVAYRAE